MRSPSLRATLPTVQLCRWRRPGGIAPLISISKRRLKQLDTIELVRQQRENHQQQLAFHTRPFVLCGLPLRRPPNSQLIHARHSGKFFLHVTAHPDFGLPFGPDRLIPIWAATLALQLQRALRRSQLAEGQKLRASWQGFVEVGTQAVATGVYKQRRARQVMPPIGQHPRRCPQQQAAN